MRLHAHIVVWAALPALTAGHAATPARLSPTDRNQIELLACRTPHAVALEQVIASQPPGPDARITADVRCKSHGDHAGNAVRFLASCNGQAGKWNCDKSGQSITMAVNGRQVTAVSQTMVAAEMYDLMLKVGNFVVPVAEPDKPRGRAATCTISGDVSDPKVALVTMNCNDWVVDVARLCATAPCRYEMGQRMYLPPRTK